MNKQELKTLFAKLWYNGSDGELLNLVMTLPEYDLDEELIFWACDMYTEIDEYYKAACILDAIKDRFGDMYQWHLKKGKVFLYTSMSGELQESSNCRRVLLDKAISEFEIVLRSDPPENVHIETCEFFELISEETEELQA